MSEYITELQNLYIAIGNMIGAPTDEQLTRINELESLFNPDTIKSDCVYRCPRCGSEWCEDDGQSWDCAARASGCPEDV
jgi:hypothetical protein